jgi:hypothetical protein
MEWVPLLKVQLGPLLGELYVTEIPDKGLWLASSTVNIVDKSGSPPRTTCAGIWGTRKAGTPAPKTAPVKVNNPNTHAKFAKLT